ncbi:MAG: zinc-binding dehydrogenase [Nitrospinota bacterium]
MKALVARELKGIESLRMEDYPDAKPGPGEVVIGVRAAALNGRDVRIVAGRYPQPPAVPLILGSDVAGVVEATGPGVARPKVGDAVVLHPGHGCLTCEWCLSGREYFCPDYRWLGVQRPGGFAERIAAPARLALPKPEGLSFEEAASFPLTFLTAWHTLVTRGGARAGEDVLVLAASSGVGVAAVQMAKLVGARAIACTSGGKVEKAKALGADEVVDYSSGRFAERVRALTGGRGADLIFDTVAGPTFGESLACLKPGGRLAVCGSSAGREVEFPVGNLYMKRQSVIGAGMGPRSEFPLMCRLIEEGKLRPVVDSVRPLSEGKAALRRMADRAMFGKLVVTP